MSLTEFVAIGSLALNVGVAVVGATWGIGKLRATISEAAIKQSATLEERIERMTRYFGESLAAIRQKVADVETNTNNKISEVELWNRDNFMRRDSFMAFSARTEEAAQRNADKIDTRLERIEGKIEQLQTQPRP